MKKNGFSLFHFLVYFSLFLMLTMLVFLYITTTYCQIFRYTKKARQQLDLYTAYDLLVSDLALASSNINLWILDNNSLIFRRAGSEEDIGWKVNTGRLLRYTGTYHRISQTWHNKVFSLVAYGIDNLVITLSQHQKNNRITYVSGKLMSQNMPNMPCFKVILDDSFI